MSIIVEGTRGFHLGGMAHIVENDRETAWAQPHIQRRDDMRYLLGNYVEADNYNSNGHFFPLGDLQTAVKDVPNTPLNLLHASNRIVGHYTAAELVYPKGEQGAEDDHPILEALAAYYHYYFPETWPAIEMAHKSGELFFSMETVPETITCRGNSNHEGCGKDFEYAGRQSPTYCDHLNQPRSRKILHKPHFTGGAIIIPPVKPGWKHADIKELSNLIERNLETAEAAYDQMSVEFPHLDPVSWERMTAWLLAANALEGR